MARQNLRIGGHRARPVGSLLAVSVCLAVGLLLVTSGLALGISGFAANEPAVDAQYPDAVGAKLGPKSVVSSLVDIDRVTVQAKRKDPARWHAIQREIIRKTTRALTSAAGLAPRETGSIVLLIAGIAVILVGVILRWRRGVTEIS